MVLSASSPSALAITGSSYTYVSKQLLSAVIGIIAMFILSRIDYRIYQKYAVIIYVISIIILALVMVPGLGRSMNGAKRWINVPIFTSIQPSEITKLGLIIFFSAYFAKYRNKAASFKMGFILPIVLLLPAIGILLGVQSHLSASIIIVLVVAIIMLMGGSKARYFAIFGTAGVSAGAIRIICTC